MPVKMRLWKIEDQKLRPVKPQPLASEELLEDWLYDDFSMVSGDLLVIGRQVPSELGGILDILAIDRNGDLAVLELKRDKTPRQVVAQALHYAAWVWTLSWEQIDQIATEQSGGRPHGGGGKREASPLRQGFGAQGGGKRRTAGNGE